ncbi:MAG: hypothetical protein MR688_04085 [Prevotella sp.]|nr:hypothetical protein [Prevotella sp.]
MYCYAFAACPYSIPVWKGQQAPLSNLTTSPPHHLTTTPSHHNTTSPSHHLTHFSTPIYIFISFYF